MDKAFGRGGLSWRRSGALVAVLSALCGPQAHAAPEVPAFSPATPSAAELKLGERLSQSGRLPQVPACTACHGADGMGMASFPRLAGAGAQYLAQQLKAFADGTRDNATMSPIAKALTEAERASTALYYSRLPAASLQAPAAGTQQAGAWLAQRGNWARNVPACASCHGLAGQGVGLAFPPLAGLPQAYVEQQLTGWKTGRPPGPLDLMGEIAARLQPDEVKAVAAYYSSFAPAAAKPAGAAGGKP